MRLMYCAYMSFSYPFLAAITTLFAATAINAQTCPFENTGTRFTQHGLMIARYALGFRGDTLVAHTGLPAAYAATFEASIGCESCGFSVTGTTASGASIVTTTDATIVLRKMAGLSGDALTAGLNLGNGSRNTSAAVQSFLATGCGQPVPVCNNAQNFCVTARSPSTAIAEWKAVSGAVDYVVLRGTEQLIVAEETQVRFRAVDLLPGGSNTFQWRAINASGAVLASASVSLSQPTGVADLTARDLPPFASSLSRGMTTFGWSPDPRYDTCSKALHDAFWTYGPDNKIYPTWHPPVYEFASNSTCRFGHEHGQDQRTSNLYGTTGALPFAYVNEQLSPSDPSFQRNEDHVGHKIALFNALPGQDRDTGAPLECDVFFKLHQGTHSPDAFRNTSHERFLNYRCTNGFEVRWKSLQSFGFVNTFTQEVSNLIPRSEIMTAGAVPAAQPAGGDRRLIPTEYTLSATGAAGASTDDVSQSAGGINNCDNCRGANGLPAYISKWNRETWQGGPGIRLVSDSTPNSVTAFGFGGGPYWNLANSSRYYAPGGSGNPMDTQGYKLGRQLSFCFVNGAPGYQSMDCQLARARGGGMAFGWDDPRSPIKGTMRFNEFNFVGLYNPDARNSRMFSDVYGNFQAGNNDINNVARTRTTALPIRQFFGVTSRELNVQAANWAGTAHCGGRSGAGACWTDFGQFRLKSGEQVDAGIHAPN
jgi:hypothetical protein